MIPVAEVQFYDVVLFFHILAVVLGFGPTFAYSAFIAIAGKDGGRAVPAVCARDPVLGPFGRHPRFAA